MTQFMDSRSGVTIKNVHGNRFEVSRVTGLFLLLVECLVPEGQHDDGWGRRVPSLALVWRC